MASETITIEAKDSDGNVLDSITLDVSTNETITITAGN